LPSPPASPTPRCVFDLAKLESQAAEIETETQKPDFWSDNVAAQSAMRRLSQLNDTVSTWRGLQKRAADASELYELAAADGDEELVGQVATEVDAIESQLDTLEHELAFSVPYDSRSAIFAVHAGAGGTDSQDWAEMLLRMYLRWCETHGFTTEVLDSMLGEEAGIKSTTVEVQGQNAYGYLSAERGVHRLVRLSPFDSAHARHTSFALVEVLPEVEGQSEVEIKD